MPKTNHISQRIVRLAWLLLLAAVLSLYIIRQMNDSPYGKDFTMFLTGAHIITAGQGANLYNLTTQAAVQAPLAGGVSFAGGVLPFNYPPYVAALFAPLSFASPDAAYYIWVAIQWLVLIGLASSIWSYCRKYRQTASATPLLMLFSFVPIFEALLMGQMSVVLLALWWLMFVNWREERWAQVGIIIALAAFKPQMVLLPIIGLVAQKRWKALLYVGVTTSALWSVSALLWGPGVLSSYLGMLWLSTSTTGSLGFVPEVMLNLRGLVTHLGVQADLSRQISMVVWLLSSGAVVWIWRAPWTVARQFGVMVILAVLFSPHLYIHDASLLFLGMVCLYVAYAEQGTAPAAGWLLLPMASLSVSLYLLIFQVANSWTAIIASAWLLGCVLFVLFLKMGRAERPAAVPAQAGALQSP